jgi:hypothetical protein
LVAFVVMFSPLFVCQYRQPSAARPALPNERRIWLQRREKVTRCRNGIGVHANMYAVYKTRWKVK